MRRVVVIITLLLLAGMAWGATISKWQDDSAMATKFPQPRTVYQGKLVGGYKTSITAATKGLSLWNGVSYEWGGSISTSTSGEKCGQMWGIDGVGLFAINYKDSATMHTHLFKSATGATFTSVLTPTAMAGRDALARSLIDLGRHTLSAGERRVLLFCEYVNTGGGDIWVSKEANDADAGNNGTWSKLFASAATAVRHFHGGVYVKGKGLYVFTGDSGITSTNDHCSILFCAEADIPTLIDSPSTFFAADHWALTTGDRDSWDVDYSSNYILIGNTQQARTVDLLTVDGLYGYYVCDSPTPGGNPINKVNFNATSATHPGTISTIRSNGFYGLGWYGCTSKQGLIYITSRTRYETTDWREGCRPTSDIWCINPDSDTARLVKSFPVLDTTPPTEYEMGPLSYLFEYGGTIMGLMPQNFFEYHLGDTSTTDMPFYGFCLKQQRPVANLVTNGSFQTGDTTGFTFGSSMNKLSFDAGTDEVTAGQYIAGATSGATALVAVITVSSGAWATDDAAGYLSLTAGGMQGVFIPDEKIKFGATRAAALAGTNCADVVGFATSEVIAASSVPALGASGNVMRVALKNLSLPSTANLKFYLTPPATIPDTIKNRPLTFSCNLFLDSTTDADVASPAQAVNPYITAIGGNESNIKIRSKSMQMTRGVWHRVSSSIISKTTSTYYFEFMLDGYAENDGSYAVMYFTEFGLYPGSLLNGHIKQLDTGDNLKSFSPSR